MSPPWADRREVDAIIDGYFRAAEKLDDMRRHLEGRDLAGARTASVEAEELAKEPRARGREFGFRLCVD